jgi:CHAT domain-containing protein
VSDRRESHARVLLTPGSKRPAEDGQLHAFELEPLRLRGGLIVLSACETGVGQIRESEGILALDRAFLRAGAGAVVSSLWQVDDQATERLMGRFHRYLVEGLAADEALSRSVRDARKEGNPGVLAWGGFRVLGSRFQLSRAAREDLPLR